MDPVPHINKVYDLVNQEEKQRSVAVHEASHLNLSNSNALVVKEERGKKNYKKEKDKPLCTHCKMIDHTVDKGYKLHGYPIAHKV